MITKFVDYLLNPVQPSSPLSIIPTPPIIRDSSVGKELCIASRQCFFLAIFFWMKKTLP